MPTIRQCYCGMTDDLATVREHLQHPGSSAVLHSRDATLHHHVRTAVWLDSDGNVVHSHPTNPRGADVRAPDHSDYSLYRTRES